ncbi:MAG: TRAP transporter large permease subunit [Rhodospirillaceae bacterium]|nr:TRAP transporter large permease subunit [Rhodospirillaceae bacterium]
MELVFLALLIVIMASALASGFPVAFALPGSAIITIGLAAGAGELFAGDAAAYFAQGGPMNWLSAGVTNFRGIYWEVERDTLIAIPLFVFMGIMLQRSKIAEDLLVTMAQLFGPIRGGLGIAVVFVGALLAATTGIVGATVVAMGLISLPAMMRNNYSNSLATGTIAASGTLGQIIPPSIVLIILADQLASAVDQADVTRKAYYKTATGQFSLPSEFGVASTSAGDMFMGALLPGLVLVGLYMVYILILSFFRPNVAPAVAFSGSYDRKFAVKVLLSLVPPLTLILVVLGSIITGVATVNQAGAIGAIGSTIMAGYRLYEGRSHAFTPAIISFLSLGALILITNSFNVNVKDIKTSEDVFAVTIAAVACTIFVISILWSLLRTYATDNTLHGVMMETAKTSSLVFIILLGAAMLTAAFRAFGGEDLVREFLTGLPGGFWAQFIVVMAVIFVLGFFLDFIEIAVVVVPIVAPILLMDPSANVTAVWLGVMIGLNIQTSFLTPPFGFALFYLRGVAPSSVRTIEMYKGVIPFIGLQLLALVIVAMTPQLVNYLPSRISLTAETAPPPRNPRLQVCMEEYINQAFTTRGSEIRSVISDARVWDLSYMPKKQSRAITTSIDKADSAFKLLDTAFRASQAVEDAAGAFRPIQRKVRLIEAKIAKDVAEAKELKKSLSQSKRQQAGATKRHETLALKIAKLESEIKKLRPTIPGDWKQTYKTFNAILKAEKKARQIYRRTTDQAYVPIQELVATIQAVDALTGVADRIRGLEGVISTNSPTEVEAEIKAVERLLNKVAATSDIKSSLTKARRAMKAKKPKLKKALAEHAKAVALLDGEIAWRTKAQGQLLSKVQAYEAGIRDTIGLRQQPRLPRNIALEVASCGAGHRDISLHF